MKAIRIILLTLIGYCLTVACDSKTDGTDSLADAESAIAEGSFDSAQKICDGLSKDNDVARMPVNVRCRLALLYMKLAERQHESENTAAAMECYRTASIDAPDSVEQAFANLPVEDMQYVMILSSLVSPANGDSLQIREHEPDSLYVDGILVTEP